MNARKADWFRRKAARLNCHFAHMPTMICALTTHLRAKSHSFVILECLALLSASIAKLSTGDTNSGMLRRTPKQGIGRLLAHLRAVSQQHDVRRLGILAALLQAITLSLQTHDMSTPTALNAILCRHRHPCHRWHCSCLGADTLDRQSDY